MCEENIFESNLESPFRHYDITVSIEDATLNDTVKLCVRKIEKMAYFVVI